MFFVVTDDGRLIGSSPTAYTVLQEIAAVEKIGVYEIEGERTGRTAEPKTEIDSLRIVAVDGETVWAITDGDDGWRFLYSGTIGQPLKIVGDNMSGIPADCPVAVPDVFWGK